MLFRNVTLKYLHDSNAEYSDAPVDRFTFFSVGAASRHLT